MTCTASGTKQGRQRVTAAQEVILIFACSLGTLQPQQLYMYFEPD